ncbi:MAG TPA: cytochrome P450 [Candidatus Nanopelagicales bacterium]|nr:cytochrome P450 [Candidatus Nanopelagicales bacterium]
MDPGRVFDLMSPEALRDPHPVLHRMRAEDPVHWAEALNVWILTRYDDVTGMLRDPRLSAQRADMVALQGRPGGDPAVMKDFVRVMRDMMLMKDGAEHTRLRKLGNRGLTAATLDSLRPIIQRITNDLLDRVAPNGRMDVIQDLSALLPSTVIAELFRIPEEDRPRFQAWSEDLMRFVSVPAGDVEAIARAANRAIVELEAYFLGMLEERRGRPGDDLLSLFLSEQEEGRFSPEEICAQCILLISAGHVTTIDQLGTTVWNLLTHPRELEKLRAAPELLSSAVEEALRYDPAIPFINRITAEDMEVGGKRIPKGHMVFLGVAAANRDPAVFADPDRFDITRADSRHIAFILGPHTCLGAGLARRELEIGLRTLLRRMPGLRLDPEDPPARQTENLALRGFYRLPVLF